MLSAVSLQRRHKSEVIWERLLQSGILHGGVIESQPVKVIVLVAKINISAKVLNAFFIKYPPRKTEKMPLTMQFIYLRSMRTLRSKALGSKRVTLFGIITFVSWVFTKALPPMSVTLFGIITLVSGVSRKALAPMCVTLSPIITLDSWVF
jgi:hypothetical protein